MRPRMALLCAGFTFDDQSSASPDLVDLTLVYTVPIIADAEKNEVLKSVTSVDIADIDVGERTSFSLGEAFS